MLPLGADSKSSRSGNWGALQQRNGWEFARRLGFDWGQIVLFYWLAARIDHIAGYILATLLIGWRQHALALLGHDGAHQLVSRNKRWNDLLTNATCFWPIGGNLDGYRDFHFRHHRELNTERDPEHALQARRSSGQLVRTALLDLVGFGSPMLLNFMAEIRPKQVGKMVAPWLLQAAFIAACVLSGHAWIAIVWYAAEFTSFAAVFRLRTVTEHLAADGTHRFHAGPFSRYVYLPHNTHCHYEHHRVASVPCYNLPQLRALLSDAVPVVRERHVFGAITTSARRELIEPNRPVRPACDQ